MGANPTPFSLSHASSLSARKIFMSSWILEEMELNLRKMAGRVMKQRKMERPERPIAL